MSVNNYLRAGQKHTMVDAEGDMDEITKTRNELKGNINMAIKFCKIGRN